MIVSRGKLCEVPQPFTAGNITDIQFLKYDVGQQWSSYSEAQWALRREA